MRRDVFQAIADPRRRDIIALLARQPMTPNAVAESFQVSRQAISKHIQILTECGILMLEHQGRERQYRIQPQKLAEVAQWVEPFRRLWEDKFDRLDSILNKQKTTTDEK